jgi:hypothetical protein
MAWVQSRELLSKFEGSKGASRRIGVVVMTLSAGRFHKRLE